MSRANALRKLAMAASPDGRNWPDKGAMRFALVPPAPLSIKGMACEVVAEIDTHCDHVEVEVRCGADRVALLRWHGPQMGWATRVTHLPDGEADAFESYLARLREAIEAKS